VEEQRREEKRRKEEERRKVEEERRREEEERKRKEREEERRKREEKRRVEEESYLLLAKARERKREEDRLKQKEWVCLETIVCGDTVKNSHFFAQLYRFFNSSFGWLLFVCVNSELKHRYIQMKWRLKKGGEKREKGRNEWKMFFICTSHRTLYN